MLSSLSMLSLAASLCNPPFVVPSCLILTFVTPPLLTVLQEFATSGSSNTDTGKSGGHLETKYKMKELGLNFSQKWNTNNTLTTEVTVEDQVHTHTRSNASATFRSPI